MRRLIGHMDLSASAELVCVDPKEIRRVWPHASRFIRAAINQTGLSDFNEVEDSILDGDSLLWLAWNGRAIEAAASTRLERANGQLACVIVACGGSDMSRWLGLIAGIEKYAQDEGCVCTRIIGRKGWMRALKDYQMHHVILERRF